jgi:hypothetical protein
VLQIGQNKGRCTFFFPKRYNPAYNLQSMTLDREVDKVSIEEI